MKRITIEPTPEMYDVPLKGGVKVPCRIWKGVTDDGIEIEAYVLSIVPGAEDAERFAKSLPPFMKRSREVYDIDTSDQFAKSVHETGGPPEKW